MSPWSTPVLTLNVLETLPPTRTERIQWRQNWVRPSVCWKPEIVIATFVVERGLETILLDITRAVTKTISGKRKIFCLQVGKSHRVARVKFRLSLDDNHGGPSEEVILPSLFSRSRKMQLAIYSKKKLAAFTVENWNTHEGWGRKRAC